MKYQANSTALSQSTDCLIIGIYENNEFTKSFNEIDQITKGYLSQLAQSQDLSGKIGQATLLHSLPNLAAKRLLVAGCGKKGETTERQFKQIIQRVTQTLKELTTLPGVGRKTADVVLSNAFNHDAIAVDTHVFRVTNRIGIVNEKNVEKTEFALMDVIPKNRWSHSHHLFIFHGRRMCKARKPECDTCPIKDDCDYYNNLQK